MPEFDRESWARDLLTRMGYPVSDNNVTSVMAWEIQEGGHTNGATWNPLNSTLGHQTFGSMNSVGVSTYPDYETGMAQTIKTINLGYYDKIRADLKAGADPSVTTEDVKASPWGTWHGGASTAGAIGRAKKAVTAHPAATPATAAPAAVTPAAVTAAAPAAVTAATPAAVTAAAVATPASGSFTGADVDGLDHLATEFTGAADIVDQVKSACEAIVAAASFFGPFGAAFVAYLKGTVIPWLTKISSSLRAMSTVLTQHSTAQKDASSASTSLPSYTTPTVGAPAVGTPAQVTPVQTPAAVVAAAPMIGAAT